MFASSAFSLKIFFALVLCDSDAKLSDLHLGSNNVATIASSCGTFQ